MKHYEEDKAPEGTVVQLELTDEDGTISFTFNAGEYYDGTIVWYPQFNENDPDLEEYSIVFEKYSPFDLVATNEIPYLVNNYFDGEVRIVDIIPPNINEWRKIRTKFRRFL